MDSNHIPSGKYLDVSKTPFDFQNAKPLKDVINNSNFKYEHYFVLEKRKENYDFAAELYEPRTGILMHLFTDRQGILLTNHAHFQNTNRNEIDKKTDVYYSLSLDAQNYPDAINHSHFPSIIWTNPNSYTQNTVYQFSVKK
jgi:aldose 1-epimerase